MSALLPAYYQIKQVIKGWIVNREFNINEKIYSENELASMFNVSRLTVRQAISQLVQEGFLTSKRGGGTFVTGSESLIKSFRVEATGFMDDLFYQVSKSKVKSVEMTRIAVPKLTKEKLELGDKDKEIIQIKRVRILEKRSFAYTVNHLPLEIGAKIREKDLYKKPLLEIMELDLSVKFTEAYQTIEASFANQEVAEKLGIPPGSPVLFVERIMYVKNKKPIELVQSSYPGDLYKYIIRLRNIKRKERNFWVHRPM